jgi:hypothetical protein
MYACTPLDPHLQRAAALIIRAAGIHPFFDN